MDDINTAASSPAEIQIPKSRLDEEIARRRELEQQLLFQQGQLNQLTQMVQGRGAQVPVDAELEELKESNPALYKKIVNDAKEKKEIRAGLFHAYDRIDRAEFLQSFGEVAKKRLDEVEKVLAAERQRGNTSVNREGVLKWILGQEKLVSETRGAPQSQTAAQAAPAPVANSAIEAPSSDPRQAASVPAGTASKSWEALSKEEREKELENVEF